MAQKFKALYRKDNEICELRRTSIDCFSSATSPSLILKRCFLARQTNILLVQRTCRCSVTNDISLRANPPSSLTPSSDTKQ